MKTTVAKIVYSPCPPSSKDVIWGKTVNGKIEFQTFGNEGWNTVAKEDILKDIFQIKEEILEELEDYIEEVTPQADWNQTTSTGSDYIKNKPADVTDLSVHVSSELSDGMNLVKGPASSVDNSIPVFDGVTGKLLKESSVKVDGDNMKPQLITFKTPSELTGTNAMDFNLNQNWIVYLSGATTTITMTPITASAVFTATIEVVQDATGGRNLVLVDVDGKAIVNTQEFDFTTGGANERCFITIKYWVTRYRYLVDKYI